MNENSKTWFFSIFFYFLWERRYLVRFIKFYLWDYLYGLTGKTTYRIFCYWYYWMLFTLSGNDWNSSSIRISRDVSVNSDLLTKAWTKTNTGFSKIVKHELGKLINYWTRTLDVISERTWKRNRFAWLKNQTMLKNVLYLKQKTF